MLRLLAAGQISDDADLVLLDALGGVDGLGGEEKFGSKTWALDAASGDLGVRYALARRPTPLVVAVSCPDRALQADVRERAALRRVIRPLARDVLGALSDHECAAIDEARCEPALRVLLQSAPEQLFAAAASYTWGDLVRESDAIAVLGAAALGPAAAAAESAPALLALWLANEPDLPEGTRDITRAFLERRFPRDTAELEAALQTGPRRYVAQAALTPRAASGAMQAELVAATLRHLRERSPADGRSLVDDVLRPAEDAFVARRLKAAHHPLLAQAAIARIAELARVIERGEVPSDAAVAELDRYLYADRDADVEALRRLVRLVRATRTAERLDLPHTVDGFAQAYRAELVWGDLAARRARDAVMTVPEVRAAAMVAVKHWYALRDSWNATFASTLSAGYGEALHAKQRSVPLGLHRVVGEVVRPLALAVGRVFLIVLDGCDLASFIEIAVALDDIRVAPVCPPSDAILPLFEPATGSTARAHVALGLAPIPTITSHARRAIFAGAIPDGAFLDEDEARAGNSPHDRNAFEHAASLRGIERVLYLKGDLAEDGAGLCAALRESSAEPRVIAAIFNAVDDALSSKQSAPLPQWTLGRLGPALQRALTTAIECGWPIVLTADHGNTPYREGIKGRGGFKGARFVELPNGPALPETVIFEQGDDIPRRVAVLSAVGAHGGPEHVGYHGGASLEEVFVPLALLGSGTLDRESIAQPSWWTESSAVRFEPAREAVVAPAPRSRGSAATAKADALAKRLDGVLDGIDRSIVISLMEREYLDDEQIAQAHGLKKGLVRTRIATILAKLEDADLPELVVIDDDAHRYHWIGN